MNEKHKKYLRKQLLYNFLVNGILNGIIAYFMNLSKSAQLEAYTMQENRVNLIIDIAITAIIFAWLIAWSINSSSKQAGVYASIKPANKFQAWMGEWFRIPARYGWIWCIAVVPALFLVTLLGLEIFNVTKFTLWGWTLYKTGYTAVMGAVFAYIFIKSAAYGDYAYLVKWKKR